MGWEARDPEKFWHYCYYKAKRRGWDHEAAEDFAQEAALSKLLEWHSTFAQIYSTWKRKYLGSKTSNRRQIANGLRWSKKQETCEIMDKYVEEAVGTEPPSYEPPEWKLSHLSLMEKMIFALLREGFKETEIEEVFFPNDSYKWKVIRLSFWDQIYRQAESEGVPADELTRKDARGRIRKPRAYNTSTKRRETESKERQQVERNLALKQTLSDTNRDILDLFREP